MSDNIPDWAIERAIELFRAETRGTFMDAFARYISEHEEPPTDVVAEALREAFGAAAPKFVSAFRAALAKRDHAVARIGDVA